MTAATASSWTLHDWEQRLRGESAKPMLRFAETELDGLEPTVRRHRGARLLRHTAWPMRSAQHAGQHQLGRWLPFRARQVLAPHEGFIWATRVAAVISGSDQYLRGTGGMDWKLGGLLTVAHEEGPDVSRSSAGRGGAEAIWLPTAMLPRYGVRWTAEDDTHITAHYQVAARR